MRAPQKIQILKFIGEQGIASIADIASFLSQPEKSESIRRTLYKLGVGQIKLAGIKHGIWYINKPELYKLLNCYYPFLPLYEIRPIASTLFPHYLEINRIRIAIQKSSQIVIDEWWSEHYIRAITPVWRNKAGNSIIPDAIFWRKRPDGTRQQFFLEYERSLKNKERYEDIFCSYAKREGVENRNVLYICGTSTIRKELLSIEERLAQLGKLEGAGIYFQFVTLESFYKTYSNEQITKESNL